MFSLRLAVRFLKSGKGQTILIIIGIGVAVAAQVFIGLLITSLQSTLVDRTVGHQPQITITSSEESGLIRGWQTTVQKIDATGLVNTVSVSASGNAVALKGKKTAPVVFRGLDAQADKIYGIRSSVYAGAWDPSSKGVLVGRDLADELEYDPGNYILVQTPGGAQASYRIDGFYDLGVASLNKTWIIANLNVAQSLFGYSGNITAIEMKVGDLFLADTLAARLKADINDSSLSVENWKAQNAQLLSGLQGQSLSSLMIQVFIVVSVVIAIASILAITVFQKSRQLGILKAMGIKDLAASLIFIFEGLIIGLAGATVGLGLGLGLIYGFALGTAEPGVPPLVELTIDYRFLAISWLIAVAAAVLAALIPARRSLRLNPIDVIREG
jgi:lipoprotein-releasing system permease protein